MNEPIKLTYDGKPMETLHRLIAHRMHTMREMSAQSVSATAIDVLKSIRAQTKVAKPEKASHGFVLRDSDVVAGFKGVNKGNAKARRVIREKGGHEMTGVAIVNLAGSYTKTESVKVWTVIFKYINFKRKGAAYDRFYVIAKNKSRVATWAKRKLGRYIKIYGGMARFALGQAMHQIAASAVTNFFEGLRLGKSAKSAAIKSIVVRKHDTGLDSGVFSIHVEDNLSYAMEALKGGQTAVDLALRRAANSIAAKINRAAGEGLSKRVETPFPEIARSRKR